MVALILVLIILAVMGELPGDNGSLVMGIIAIVIMLVSSVMRLRDAGKSMMHLILLFIIPGYLYIIGLYKSEEWHSF